MASSAVAVDAAPVRTGWRRIAVHVARLVGGLFVVIAATSSVQLLLKPIAAGARHPGAPVSASLTLLLGLMLVSAIGLGAFAVFVRLTEGRWPSALKLSPAAGEMLAGLAIGALLSATTVALLWSFGAYKVVAVANSGAWGPVVLAALPIALLSGIIEETLARGVIMRQLALLTTPGLGLAVSSLLFGFSHLFNPGASIVVAIGLAAQAGVLLGAAYLLTRRLWLAIGIHMAWNFMQAAIVGGALSGRKVTSIITAAPAGPDWLSGGSFGIEGSIVATLVCLAAGLAMLVLARRRGLDLGDRRFQA